MPISKFPKRLCSGREETSLSQETCFSIWSGEADERQDEENRGGRTKKAGSGSQEML